MGERKDVNKQTVDGINLLNFAPKTLLFPTQLLLSLVPIQTSTFSPFQQLDQVFSWGYKLIRNQNGKLSLWVQLLPLSFLFIDHLYKTCYPISQMLQTFFLWKEEKERNRIQRTEKMRNRRMLNNRKEVRHEEKSDKKFEGKIRQMNPWLRDSLSAFFGLKEVEGWWWWHLFSSLSFWLISSFCAIACIYSSSFLNSSSSSSFQTWIFIHFHIFRRLINHYFHHQKKSVLILLLLPPPVTTDTYVGYIYIVYAYIHMAHIYSCVCSVRE